MTEKSKKVVGVTLFIPASMVSLAAGATDSVTVNGRTTTCDNQCVVTVGPNGTWSVRDCCGSRIHVRFQTQQQ